MTPRSPALPAFCAAALALLAPSLARADADAAPPASDGAVGADPRFDEATARADEVSFDARSQRIVLRGNVRVDAAPFHLRSDAVEIERTPLGLEMTGDARVAFCPCLGTPLAIHVAGATVAPPGDLFLERPTLEVFGLPVLYLPKFWLRSPTRVGVLPPTIAWRGDDGLLLGGGVHVPWNSRTALRRPWPDPEDPPDRVLSLRGAGYLKGGARTEATFQTTRSVTRATWDYLDEHGVSVESRGSAGDAPARLAWDVDALRGARAVRSESALGKVALPYDRAAAEGAVDGGGVAIAAGARLASPRGADFASSLAGGPDVTLRRSGALLGAITYDATLDGGVYGLAGASAAGERRALSFARGELGLEAARAVGPLVARARARGVADAASDGAESGDDRAGAASVDLGLPVGRALGEGPDPWLHRVEPSIGGGVLAARERGLLGPGFARIAPVDGAAGLLDAGLATALGRWAHRDGLELELRGGLLATSGELAPAARGRAVVSTRWAALGVEAGVVGRDVGAVARGGALAARGRLGESDGWSVALHAEGRGEADPVAARALAHGAVEPRVGFLSRDGWTGGLALQAPVGRAALLRGGLDADVDRPELVGARGGFVLRDGCKCLALSGLVTRRTGRDGVDALLVLDIDAGGRN